MVIYSVTIAWLYWLEGRRLWIPLQQSGLKQLHVVNSSHGFAALQWELRPLPGCGIAELPPEELPQLGTPLGLELYWWWGAVVLLFQRWLGRGWPK